MVEDNPGEILARTIEELNIIAKGLLLHEINRPLGIIFMDIDGISWRKQKNEAFRARLEKILISWRDIKLEKDKSNNISDIIELLSTKKL